MDQVRRALRNFLLDIALNALVPVVLYRLSKVFLSPSEFTALVVAMTFPMARSLFGLARYRRLDPVSVIVLLGLGASAIAVVFGGSPRILLIRESFFTAVFGVACFVSLLLRRPMMFYFGRHFLGGVNPLKVRRYEMSWQLPEVRRVNRLITMVWGSVFLGEFVIRVILVYSLPVSSVLVASPLLLGSLTLGAIVWTFRRARRERELALPKIDKLLADSAHDEFAPRGR